MKTKPQRKTIRLQREFYERQGQPFSLTICTDDKTHLSNEFLELIFDSIMKGNLAKVADLMAVCVMSDHVHLLMAPISENLIDLIGRWKSYTTRLMLEKGWKGKTWQRSFYDHALRKDEDIVKVAEYIVNNPIRRGLVGDWAEYRYSWHKWM
jgi:REP element-mobilizing transposase RayT